MSKCFFYLALLLALPALASQTYSGSSYTLTLPDGWVEIPPDVVRARLAQTGGGNFEFLAGFQQQKDPIPFTYPYVLVQRIGYPAGKTPTEADMRQIVKQLPNMDSPGQLDAKNRRFTAYLTQTVAGIGRVKGVLHGNFGRNESININCYAREQDFLTHQPAFDQFANSFRFNSGQEYKRGAANALGMLGAAGIIAIIVGVIVIIIKKRSA